MNNIAAYILAGGKSQRMGEDKGLILVHNKALINYVIDACKKVCDQVFIVTNQDIYKQFELPLIADTIQDAGPAGGIDSILQHSKTEKNLVVSCDMPCVDPFSIKKLIEESKSFDITIPLHEPYMEPLLGVYSKQIASQWRSEIWKGNFKLSDIIAQFAVNFVDAKQLLKYNKHLFANMNNPDDIENLKTWLK
ncbi:MAG: molybdenum cofactor guanylyltransferase [Chitinophagaceae bacterium]